MKLSQIAAKPQLIKFVLDDEDTVKEFGESLEFYSWDRQPLDIFMQLANAQRDNGGQLIDIVRKLILDEDGKEIISKDVMLPSNVMIRVIAKIVEQLGK